MKQFELVIKYSNGEIDRYYTRLNGGKGWETNLTDCEAVLEEMREIDPETFQDLDENGREYWAEEIPNTERPETNKEMLEEAQRLLGLNQKELGIFAGVSARCVNAWMTGERAVPSHVAEMINRLAHADHDALEDVRPTTAMLRWAVITARGIDEWMTVCGNKADALREAADQWRRLTEDERKKVDRFEVSLVKVQIVARSPLNCGRFEYYEGADGQIDGEVYECAKDYLQD